VRAFVWLCLKSAFRHPIWEKTQGIATAIIVVLGFITFIAPRLLSFVPKFSEWAVVAFVLAAVVLFRLLMSPYWVYRAVYHERDKAESERDRIKAELEREIEERKKAASSKKLRDTIVLQLSRLMDAGEKILVRLRGLQSGAEIEAEAEKWFSGAQDFLNVSLGETGLAWFRNTSAVPIDANAPDEKYFWQARLLFDSVYARVYRLRELIEKVQAGTITPRGD
jgi:hypothetical protein